MKTVVCPLFFLFFPDMTKLTRCTLLSIGLLAVLVFPLAGTAFGGPEMLSKYVSDTCDVENDYVVVRTMNFDDIQRGIRPPAERIMSFDKTGILFKGFGVRAFGANYDELEKIQFVKEKDHERGVLTVIVNYVDGKEAEELGYVQFACWQALTAFFERHDIKVKLDESIVNQ